ncbi:MAG: ribose-phosphate pyrophosphokinase [Nitrososphaerota archaeon]|nr:ribose-phosphate pyrophosphokinase [Candidatus Bathyarchaeota archaeon]MCX8162584.1 ribose-phosphate pyrophosphokinase [Candidatus Bathyarchaeota archaeon]MDW8061765.1 ribose-phosphate pyrophosphokinase [Nitrososphaerota archaeon]
MKVVAGPSSQELASRVAEQLGVGVVESSWKHFPDGEFYFRFHEDISGEELIVVQSLYPPQNEHIFELLAIVHTARDLGASKIVVFAPYLAYSRQDERYLPGETVTSKLLAEILCRIGIDAIYTVDIHNLKVLEYYTVPAYNLTASPLIARYFVENRQVSRPFLLAPDDEEAAIKRVEEASKALGGVPYDALEKSRDRYTGRIETREKLLEVEGMDIIIIDDIISTGGTVANAARISKKMKARKVYVGVTHALLRGDALKLMEEAGVDEVVSTDSVPAVTTKISVAPLLREALIGKL